jgi:hypothetical protein
MKSESEIRDLILYQREKLFHEVVEIPEDMYGSFNDYRDLPDEEIRGVIRALRWVLEEHDEDYR